LPADRRTAAVLLAAGAGTRFAAADGTHKLLADWRGRPLVWWALQSAVDAAIGPVWVVTGAAAIGPVMPDGVRLLPNPRWAEGQATSLAVAVEAASAAGLDAVVVGLGDQPLIPPEAWRRVAGAAGPLAVATYGGQRGNPVRLGSEVWPRLPTTGDAGARVVMRECPDMVEEVACDGNPVDVDTVQDLRLWS
jgi:molybdenum cofactor cytidylyltransferase